jgi:hypothetical protein
VLQKRKAPNKEWNMWDFIILSKPSTGSFFILFKYESIVKVKKKWELPNKGQDNLSFT